MTAWLDRLRTLVCENYASANSAVSAVSAVSYPIGTIGTIGTGPYRQEEGLQPHDLVDCAHCGESVDITGRHTASSCGAYLHNGCVDAWCRT
jgi:hypothetical protein